MHLTLWALGSKLGISNNIFRRINFLLEFIDDAELIDSTLLRKLTASAKASTAKSIQTELLQKFEQG